MMSNDYKNNKNAASSNNKKNNNNDSFELHQLVRVEPRLWSGINRPGGVGRITKIRYCNLGYVETVDVKYIVGSGSDTMVDLAFLQPHEELARTSRSRRGRDFLMEEKKEELEAEQPEQAKKKKAATTTKSNKKPRIEAPAVATTTATREVDTKASTKGRMTLQTGSELRTTSSSKTNLKAPVKYIQIHAPGTAGATTVSPLAVPFLASKKSTAQPKCFAVKRPSEHNKKQKNKVSSSSRLPTIQKTSASDPTKTKNKTTGNTAKSKKTPTSSTPCLYIPDDKPAAIYLKTTKNTLLDAARSPPRVLPLSSRRVPLRQVFDNDMDVRNNFVSDVVGENKQVPIQTKKKAVADPAYV
jgi:hypothetical protein